MGTWTEKEKGVMRDFIKNNPDVGLKTQTIHPLLIGCFNDRTPEAIYHGWRRLKGLKPRYKTKLKKRPVHQELPGFIKIITELIEEFLETQVRKIIWRKESILLSENEELIRTINEIKKLAGKRE